MRGSRGRSPGGRGRRHYPGAVRLGPPSPNKSEALRPVAVNMKALFLVGTAVWVTAGVVVGVLLATGALADPEWLAVCVVGAGIGVGGWIWARWRRA